jgi:hypothetical protein
MSTSPDEATTSATPVDDDVVTIATEIWSELEASSTVEPPFLVKPFYNEMCKKEDKTDFKRPLEMTSAEYLSVTPKLNWNATVKYSLFSISSDPLILIRLCHLLVFTAWKLKIFGEDAYGKVTACCKVGSNIINYLLEKNRVFFPVTAGRQRVPTRVRSINEETFKSAVVDLVKCCSDTALQRHYVGDGHGDPSIAGLGIPPGALTDGSAPSAEILFKRSLHEVKGLLESKSYLSNPNSAAATAARAQAVILDGINDILSGGLSTAATNAASTAEIILESNNTNRMSPLSVPNHSSTGEESKRKSPATLMAEASLLSQEAAVKDADNLSKMIRLQEAELKLRKDDAVANREERKEELRLQALERTRSTEVLQKIIDKLCPDADPTEKFTARKRKLDECRDTLGEELYHLKLRQLTDEFLKASAM